MKKFILFFLIAFVSVSASYASDTTGRASTFAGQIKSYLRSEGYAPDVDSDNDIFFKYEGKKYYISVENYDNGVYVKTFRFVNGDDYSMSALCKAANEAQRSYKFIRIDVLDNKGVSIGVCQYFSTFTTYKTIFSDMLTVINSGFDALAEALPD